MRSRLPKSILFALLGFAISGSFLPAATAEDISLKNSTVIVDRAEPSYVHYAIEELRQQIKSITGEAPGLSYDLDSPSPGGKPLIIVGRAMAERLASTSPAAPRISDDNLGPQGFVLAAVSLPSKKAAVVASGTDAEGTNYAVMQLRRLLIESTSGISVPASLKIQDKPKYQLRGLYLHQHWHYNNPYATWSWSVENWKSAIDLAAYMRVNVVMLWPHMDMMAPPLSVVEEDRLADLKEVADYAHRKRGMKVWLIEAPNVLLDSDEARALPLENRDYYAFHYKGKGLKNPGDPEGFKAMMANRAALYQDVPNADAYGYIDSDPGGWDGSPSSAFIDLLAGNRKLLDQYHQTPEKASLIYWVWGSWGTGTVQENWRNAMSDFQARVTGPKQFLLGWAPHVEIAEQMAVLGESVFFPYGVIEGEPTFPLTSVNFDEIARSFDFASNHQGLEGVMANSQTLFAQLPNLYYFFSTAWTGKPPESSLRSLARDILPGHETLLAEGWDQLNAQQSSTVFSAANKLDTLAGNCATERVGVIGENIFPSEKIVVRDLANMLRIHGNADRVQELVKNGKPVAEVSEALAAYFREMLTWQRTNGFFGAYGVDKKIVFDNYMYDRDSRMVRAAWQKVAGETSQRQELEASITSKLLAAGYKEPVVKGITGQLFGTAHMGQGDDNPVFKKLPPQSETRPWARR